MKPHSAHFLIGIFFILLGSLFLLNSLGILRSNDAYTSAAVFFSAGIVLTAAHFLYHQKVWALILGCIGIFIGSAIYIDATRSLPDDAIGMIFLVLIGLVFLTGLRDGKRKWWVVIPGGFCFIIAAHVLLDITWWLPDEYHGVIFFGGMGLIFGIVYLMRDATYKLDWAKYPSLIAFCIAALIVLTIDFNDAFGRFIFPAVLILVGGLLMTKSMKRKTDALADKETNKTTQEKTKTTTAPKSPVKPKPKAKRKPTKPAEKKIKEPSKKELDDNAASL